MNKKTISVIVIFTIIFLTIFLLNNEKQEGRVIKIGVVAPITGGLAGYGDPLVKGIELAIADLHDKKNKYEFIFEDDETNPAKAASAAQKLVNINKVDAIITTTAGTGNAVKPIAALAKIPHMSISVDLSIADNITNFTYLPLPKLEAEAWVSEAISRGIKKVAIISQNQAGLNLIIDNIKAGLSDNNIKVVFEERHDPSTKDFKTVIAKARNSSPDVYLVLSFSPALDILGKEFNALGINNLAGVGTFAIALEPKNFEGNWFTDARLTDLSLKERFEKTFPGIRFNIRTVPYGYDVSNILVSAFESDRPASEFIKNLTSFNGKVGHVTKNSDSGSFNPPIGIWEIRDGKPVMIK